MWEATISLAPVDSHFEERRMSHVNEAFEPTPAQQTYLAQQLGAVSRSFALVIPFLETPLRHYLAIAYLLCRVVDNIEDCGRPTTWQDERFSEFSHLLRDPHDAGDVLPQWEREEWPALTEQERRLMSATDGIALWQMYAQMPHTVQDRVCHWTSVMAQGMGQLSDPEQRPFSVQRKGIEVLETAADYDDYCFYVAGTVGHLATELVVRQYQFPEDIAQAMQPYAEACGRSLQKTNIVKDFAEDLARGMCYLPDAWLKTVDYAPLDLRGAAAHWTAMVLVDVLDELRKATDYLVALPYSAPGYRRASLLCLLTSYHTIYLAAQRREILFTPEHKIKISRVTMAQCVVDSQVMLYDNESIRRYGQRLEIKIHRQLGV
jgi:phytoene/squalene synthetase